ncbi:4923_t:CDS:1 [Funneliformis geosporum]|uniref:18053_t:CDS:1 n=1 Tax=Funneliformis geosporum TaxID=1117311 RepID=A0A9W4SHC6_9GLOM|nr:18053_t:CDS:1 [Funneliformis geosporum]CAI2170793.1 4923_t:CDS:1 [Funneliformis geosporum]
MQTSTLFTNEVIIREILKFLKDEDISLYAYLFINKYWLRLTTTLLWKKPFQNLKETKSNSLITTYISCLYAHCHDWLNEEERSMIYFMISSYELSSPFYEYERYLKEIPFKSLNKAVIQWFDHVYGEHDKKAQFTRNIELKLFKMFAKKSICIESIAIDFEVGNFSNIFEGETSKISNLKSLLLSFPPKMNDSYVLKIKNFLRGLQNVLQSLEEVFFLVDETERIEDDSYSYSNSYLIEKTTDEIIAFVNSQKHLKGFNLVGEENVHLNAKRIILPVLRSHVDSLTYLNIDNVDFGQMAFQYFEKCASLESLGMSSCTGLTTQFLNPNTTFPNLKKLELSLNRFNLEMTSLILKKAGENLTELEIDDVSDEILNTIVVHCNKIESLTISGRYFRGNLNLPKLRELKCLKRLELLYVADVHDVPKMERAKSEIKDTVTRLFDPEEFDQFYDMAKEFDYSFVSITFFNQNFQNFYGGSDNNEFDYAQCSLEIKMNNSVDSDQRGDNVYVSHITLKKQRSKIELKFKDLLKKLQDE